MATKKTTPAASSRSPANTQPNTQGAPAGDGPEQQIDIVRQLAGIVHEFREHPARFTKFELMCGLNFGTDPVTGLIRVTPSKQEEQFRCKDEELLGHAGSERDAFFDAVDIFAASGAALAWNGVSPNKDFHVVREMSANFAHPVMSVDITFRRKGEADAFRLDMVFVGFDNAGSAGIYAAGRGKLLK
ncbi:MAG: hypothetical protein KL863_20395 [Rhizobium sp.]|nr:hypothetical protein [Rhizobium sp.]